MSRPHRPNPLPKVRNADGLLRANLAGHAKQETRAEAKARKRAEAEERSARTPEHRRRRYRLRRKETPQPIAPA